MASAELLKMTHCVDGKVMVVDDRVKRVEGNVQDVRGDVRAVHDDVQDVGNRIQGVDERVQDIGVDVKEQLDQVNRSLSFYHLLIISNAQTASQEINSEIAFHDGFCPQIHPPIITMHAKLTTPVQLDGFFREVYSVNGNPPDPSCGYMENVR